MKLFSKILLSLVALILVVTAALPTLLSRKSMQPTVISYVNSRIPGRIEIENYSISWFGGIYAENFKLFDPNEAEVANFERFSTDSSLMGLLWNSQLTDKTDIHSLNLNIVKNSSGQTNLEESLDIDLLLDLPSPLALSDVQLQYNPKSNKQFTVAVSGETKQEDLTGSFVVDLIVDQGNLHVKADVRDFPVGILDAIASSKNPDLFGILPKLLGKTLNVSIDETTENNDIKFTLKASSQAMFAEMEGRTDNDLLAFTSKGTFKQFEKPISWDASVNFHRPQKVDSFSSLWALMKDYKIQVREVPTDILDQAYGEEDRFKNTFGNVVSMSVKGEGIDNNRVVVSVTSEKIVIPQIQILFADLTHENISGSLIIDSLIFQTKNSISDLNVNWTYDGIKKDFSANLTGNVSGDGQIKGKVKYDDSDSRFYVSLQGNKVPAHFFELFSGENLFTPVFGNTIDTKVEMDLNALNGFTNIELQGSNGYLVLKGDIKDGTLTLNAPFYLQTTPSAELGRDLFMEHLPPLGELLAGDSPIGILIDNDGFAAPIFEFDVNKVKIKKAQIELGKLTFRNKGEIKKVAKFLNTASTDKVSIWFTPQYFSMEGGIIEIARMDFLLMDKYPMATWGKIDLSKDSIDATLGISDIALNNAFKVSGLAPNSLLQVPIKGKLDKPKVDTTVALSRIGSLVAKQKGSPEGLLIGTVLDIANGSSRDKTPAPTTNPLPWADQFKNTEVTQNEEKSTGLNKKDIEAKAKDILKGIFKK